MSSPPHSSPWLEAQRRRVRSASHTRTTYTNHTRDEIFTPLRSKYATYASTPSAAPAASRQSPFSSLLSSMPSHHMAHTNRTSWKATTENTQSTKSNLAMDHTRTSAGISFGQCARDVDRDSSPPTQSASLSLSASSLTGTRSHSWATQSSKQKASSAAHKIDALRPYATLPVTSINYRPRFSHHVPPAANSLLGGQPIPPPTTTTATSPRHNTNRNNSNTTTTNTHDATQQRAQRQNKTENGTARKQTSKPTSSSSSAFAYGSSSPPSPVLDSASISSPVIPSISCPISVSLSHCSNKSSRELVEYLMVKYRLKEATDANATLIWTDQKHARNYKSFRTISQSSHCVPRSVDRSRDSHANAKSASPVRLTNHFPDMHLHVTKSALAQSLGWFAQLFPDQFDFFPKSWDLQIAAEAKLFQEKIDENRHAQRAPKTYILKPHAGRQGDGIVLVQRWQEVQSTVQNNPGKRFVASEYIASPLLLDGFKFDCRVYVLIESLQPFRAYLFKDGLARLATSKYQQPTQANIHQPYIHLTNYSLNKSHAEFQPEVEKQGQLWNDYRDETNLSDLSANNASKRSIRTALLQLRLQGVPISLDLFWSDVESIVEKTLCAMWPGLQGSYNRLFPDTTNVDEIHSGKAASRLHTPHTHASGYASFSVNAAVSSSPVGRASPDECARGASPLVASVSSSPQPSPAMSPAITPMQHTQSGVEPIESEIDDNEDESEDDGSSTDDTHHDDDSESGSSSVSDDYRSSPRIGRSSSRVSSLSGRSSASASSVAPHDLSPSRAARMVPPACAWAADQTRTRTADNTHSHRKDATGPTPPGGESFHHHHTSSSKPDVPSNASPLPIFFPIASPPPALLTPASPSNCFHLIGFDILIDANLKCHLLEVNAAPSMNLDSSLDKRIKLSVLERSFELLGMIPPAEVTHAPGNTILDPTRDLDEPESDIDEPEEEIEVTATAAAHHSGGRTASGYSTATSTVIARPTQYKTVTYTGSAAPTDLEEKEMQHTMILRKKRKYTPLDLEYSLVQPHISSRALFPFGSATCQRMFLTFTSHRSSSGLSLGAFNRLVNMYGLVDRPKGALTHGASSAAGGGVTLAMVGSHSHASTAIAASHAGEPDLIFMRIIRKHAERVMSFQSFCHALIAIATVRYPNATPIDAFGMLIHDLESRQAAIAQRQMQRRMAAATAAKEQRVRDCIEPDTDSIDPIDSSPSASVSTSPPPFDARRLTSSVTSSPVSRSSSLLRPHSSGRDVPRVTRAASAAPAPYRLSRGYSMSPPTLNRALSTAMSTASQRNAAHAPYAFAHSSPTPRSLPVQPMSMSMPMRVAFAPPTATTAAATTHTVTVNRPPHAHAPAPTYTHEPTPTPTPTIPSAPISRLKQRLSSARNERDNNPHAHTRQSH